ncbi:hypothetical protein NHF50_15675, partial [Flavobacterium sp. NRK F10]|uniref:hypothetical protein n=1 Tax=Flavobacterium sp. NRK F10 TaxID=2954931 RepID=UPI002091B895
TGAAQVLISGATSDQVIVLEEIAIGSCIVTLSETETVIVNTVPTLSSLSSNDPICEGDDAVFDLSGTAGSTVTYTINGGTTQTVTLDGTGAAQVVIVSPTTDQSIVLSDISLGTCSSIL